MPIRTTLCRGRGDDHEVLIPIDGTDAGDQLDFLVLQLVSGSTYKVVGKTGVQTLAGTGPETFPANISAQAGEILGFWIPEVLPAFLHNCCRGGGSIGVGSVADPALNATVTLGAFSSDLNESATLDSDLALTNVPANVTVNATGPTGAVVNYTPPTATDEGGETPTVGCLPASGSTFAIGTTTVTCTATDADDLNSPVTATFTVTVTGALGQLQALLASVGALPSSTAKTVLSVQLGDAIAAEQAGNTGRVCMDLFGVIRSAQTEESYGQLTAAQATSIINAADQIAAVVGCGGVDPAPVVLRPVVKPAVKHSGHKRHRGSRVQT